MRFHTAQHTYSCGVDLYTNMMVRLRARRARDVVLQRNTFADPKSFLKAVERCPTPGQDVEKPKANWTSSTI